jgi:ComF family protein
LLGKTLGRRAARFLGNDDGLWSDVDAIIPVPLHPKREVERGFNQASLLAGELARLKGIPCLDRCLVKTKNTVPQTTLAGLDREKNIRGAYSVRKAAAVRGKVILLVDDVFTTGSTLGECSSILLKAGAKEVRALTIAQA